MKWKDKLTNTFKVGQVLKNYIGVRYTYTDRRKYYSYNISLSSRKVEEIDGEWIRLNGDYGLWFNKNDIVKNDK